MPNFEDFKQKHILNPNHPSSYGYERWDKREQNNWLKNRLANFSGNAGQSYGRKNMNSVIIATSQEILRDFRNPGMRYEPQEDFHWSNNQYPIWLYKKSGSSENGEYSVTKLNERHGPMHFLARVSPRDGNAPIHFHAQSPTPDPRTFPRYTESETFQQQIRRDVQQTSSAQYEMGECGITLASSQRRSSPAASSIFLYRWIRERFVLFGNFVLNKIIFPIFFIKFCG